MSEAMSEAWCAHVRVNHGSSALLAYVCPDCRSLVPFYRAERIWRDLAGDESLMVGVSLEELDPPL
jgi:hypothetical protein